MASNDTKPSFVQRHPTLGKFLILKPSPVIDMRSLHCLEDRKAQADKILESYPDKIPVICEAAQGSQLTLDRTK